MSKPTVGCATMVEKDGKLLLGVRGKEPGYGSLVIPGGGVELFEDFAQTAEREIKEETGIEITNLRQFGCYQIITPERNYHRIIIFWQASYKSGKLLPSSDLLSADFYTKMQIAEAVRDGKIEGAALEALRDAGWIS